MSKNYSESEALRQRAQRVIPGGAHTYAKGDDQFPQDAPAFIARGKGCRVWDVDGHEFIEYAMGLRAVTLGHAYPSVIEAAALAMEQGANFNRPSPLEVECAEALVDLIPCAEQVKFAKDGSTVVTAAIRLARSITQRRVVAICQDHPFFSYNDWFIGTTEMASGILDEESAFTKSFGYNDLGALERLIEENTDDVAIVVMEPGRIEDPAPGFLEGVRDLCTRHGIILLFDEMITGFRWHLRGAQALFGVTPDLAAFGKAIANGFSVSALCGKKEFMERGGLLHDFERVFLLSTTHGGETHGLAAMQKVLQIYREEPVIDHLYRQGKRLREGIEAVTASLDLQDHVPIMGRDCSLYFGTRDTEGKPSQPFRTLLLQELIERGIMAPSLMVSYSHQDQDIDQTIEAFSESLEVYKKALQNGVSHYLRGPAVKPVYRRYNHR